MKPDKEKLIAWIKSFSHENNPLPDLESTESKRILTVIFEDLEMFLQESIKRIEEL